MKLINADYLTGRIFTEADLTNAHSCYESIMAIIESMESEDVLDKIRAEIEELKKSDLLIIKVKSGINVKADLMDHWRKEILRQKETGVVLLPWFLNAEVVPEDVEVQFIDSKSSCVLEERLE